MIVAVCLPCLLLGGTEIATLNMIIALKKGGYQIRVCCYYEYDPEMVARFRQAGVQVDLLKRERGGLKELLSLTRDLRKYFLRHQPDVVHVQYFAPGMVPILSASIGRVNNIFATVHAAGSLGYNWKAKILFRISAFLTDHFFCVSHNTEKFWFGSVSDTANRSEFRGTGHSTIHNCVDTAKYLQSHQIPDEIPHNRPVIGIVGRIVPLKGHKALIHAFSRVKESHPDARLVVIGTGTDQEYLEDLSGQLKVNDNICWVGQIPPEQLSKYYKAMDALAMPSHWEGFGLTAVEAMAAAKPVVGTKVPGLQEIIVDGETGFLVNIGDAEALAEKLILLIKDEKLRTDMGLAGRKRVQNKFSKNVHDRKWLTAYRSLVK